MKKFSSKTLAALLVLAMFIGVALAAPNRYNTFPKREPTEADYAAFIAEKERQLALAQTPQEKKLALAEMPDAPRVTIRGTILMPDGSPLPKDAPSFHYGFRIRNFTFLQMSDGTKRIDTNRTMSHGHSGSSIFDKEDLPGGFQIENGVPLGANMLLEVYCGPRVKNSYKELLAKPVLFVAHPGMKPLEIRLEKGIPLHGKISYANGEPVLYKGFDIKQKFEPPLGADMPEMSDYFGISRRVNIDARGNYEIFLLPGEYTVRDDNQEQTLVIAETDKEKKLDWKIPTPIWVKIIDQEDDSVSGCSLWVIDDENVSHVTWSSSRWPPTVIEPADHDRLLYVMDEEKKRGTIETITPYMIGTTVEFRLKPVSHAAMTVVDGDDRPLADKNLILRIKKSPFSLDSSDVAYARTDSSGKAVFRVAPGRFSATIKFPGKVEEPGGKRMVKTIDKELDLAPGETLDMGTVRLSE